MKVSRLLIKNFRGARKASLMFPDHTVLIGDNNTGKSTVLEALDLALGPDRLSRLSPIDEHEFHLGAYLNAETDPDLQPRIIVEATVTGLSEEQRETVNHRSKGTYIAILGNDILTRQFTQNEYAGVSLAVFEANPN